MTNGFRLTHFGSVGDSMPVVVTSVRKERNFKDCIRVDFLTFPSLNSNWFIFLKVFSTLCDDICEKGEGRSRVINRGFSIPTHGLADVLLTDSSQTK